MFAATTYNGYRRNVENHIVPALGRIGQRRLRPHHLEAFYERLLHPRDGRAALAPKTVYEIHLVIRGALEDAARRGLVSRNVALVAHAPRLRSIPKVEQKSWTAEELQAFLQAAAGHRLFAALWVSAFTGMHRNELLGLRRDDFDEKAATSSINWGLVAVPYELHETRGKTPRSCRRIDLDPTTVAVLTAWREWQRTEQRAAAIDTAGWMFADGRGEPIHPHAISQGFERIARRAAVAVIRLHDVRHAHYQFEGRRQRDVQVFARPRWVAAIDGDANRSEASSHRAPVPSSVDDSADHGLRVPLVVPPMRKKNR